MHLKLEKLYNKAAKLRFQILDCRITLTDLKAELRNIPEFKDSFKGTFTEIENKIRENKKFIVLLTEDLRKVDDSIETLEKKLLSYHDF